MRKIAPRKELPDARRARIEPHRCPFASAQIGLKNRAKRLDSQGPFPGDLMTIQIERLRQEIRMENRKFAVQIVLALVAALGVGVAIGRFWLFHT
jgi:hypothetical protein